MAHARTESHGRNTDGSIHRTTAPDTPATRPESLEAFVGRWHMEGQQFAGPNSPAASISALQTYEWLPGGQFLVHRFDGHIGDAQAACAEVIGFDPDRGCYRAHTFYNNGQMNVWDIEYRDHRWLARGEWNAGNRAMRVRCTTTFVDNGKTMNSKWEHSTDGLQWQVFWDVSATKMMAS